MYRLALLALSLACVATALVAHAYRGMPPYVWPLIGIALVLAIAAERGIALTGSALTSLPEPPSRGRRALGLVVAAAGTALWAWATRALELDWPKSFDAGWLAWFTGVCLLSIGLDLARGRWRSGGGARSLRLWLVVGAIVAFALLLRFGTFVLFPAENHVTQVEELQVGGMGSAYLYGWRQRWEYLSHAWLGALGIWLGGPTLMGMRAPFTLLSALKVIPLFLWLRFAVGNGGAVVGAVLLAVSSWDVTSARVPTNQNTLVAALVFLLLAGPARRGRPSAYVWLGFSAGYVLYEYVVYRAVAVYALAGAWLVSLRNRQDSWLARLALPVFALAIFVTMAVTLYIYLEKTGLYYQYFDGWGRARAQGQYYAPNASWGETLSLRAERCLRAASLFFFWGDESPVRNPAQEPMTDPVSSTLVLLGIAYGIANPLRSGAGWAVFALFSTLAGTLVLTGNFDPVRAGGAVVYFYGIAGYGAAAVLEAFGALGRNGRRFGYLVLTVALAVACAHNLRFLWTFSTSPLIRKNQFRDIAYLSDWLGRNVNAGEYVVAITPGYSYLFEINDATWMRGAAQGVTSWDVESALARLRQRTGRSLLFVYAGSSTTAVQQYLEQLLPEVHFGLSHGPSIPDYDIASGVVEKLPDDFEQRLKSLHCRFVEAQFKVFTREGEEPAFQLDTRLPFIDASTWPGDVQGNIYRIGDKLRETTADFFGRFEVAQGGDYGFAATAYPGTATTFVDGTNVGSGRAVVNLTPGLHRIEVRSRFQPGAFPRASVVWDGPDSKGVPEPMPFYRVGSCEPGVQ